MTRPFDISNPDDTLTLDASGKGKTIFTVTNILAKPLRGELRVHGTDASKDGWFAISGSTEREFSPKVGDQVEVTAKVPPGTPAGKYGIRLDALSVAAPEEDYTEGPTITVKIPKVEPVVETGPPKWLWIVIVVVLLIVIGLVAALVMHKKGGTTTPPPASSPSQVVVTPPPPAPVEFNDPRIVVNGESLPLDVCREWGVNCGKPAADAFCASKNAGFAVKWNVAQNSPPTVVISTKQVCRDATCDRITWVSCAKLAPINLRLRTEVMRGKSVVMPE